MRLFAVALALLTITPISSSLAQNKTEISDADLKKAKEHFKTADKHFRLREFDLAIPELKEAYRLYPNPLFLYNLAQCHLELKQYEEAISFFENFLEVDPKSKNRSQAEKYLVQAREGYAAEQAGKKRQEEAARLEQEKLQQMLELEKQRQNPTSATDDTKPIFTKWWFWTAIGGVAAAGTGTTLAITSINRPPKTDLGNVDILDK